MPFVTATVGGLGFQGLLEIVWMGISLSARSNGLKMSFMMLLLEVVLKVLVIVGISRMCPFYVFFRDRETL